MSIKFRVIQRGEPGVIGGGVKKFYANAANTEEIDLDELSRDIEEFCTLTDVDILAVLRALTKVVQKNLSNSRIVRLGSLGSLRVGIKSKGEMLEADITAHSIESAHVIFSPGEMIRNMLEVASFEKAKHA